MADQAKGLEAFIDIIETIADNKYVLGDHLVEIGVSGPTLEATLSAIAMAQGELGHARLLYNWAFDLRGIGKTEITNQTGKAFPSVVQVTDWIEMIGALYAVNAGTDLVLRAMLEAGHHDVVNRIQKLLKEQKEHILYSRGWVGLLLHDEGAVPRKMREALDRAVPEVRAWLQKLEQNADLVSGGYIPEQAGFAARFDEIVDRETRRVVENAG